MKLLTNHSWFGDWSTDPPDWPHISNAPGCMFQIVSRSWGLRACLPSGQGEGLSGLPSYLTIALTYNTSGEHNAFRTHHDNTSSLSLALKSICLGLGLRSYGSGCSFLPLSLPHHHHHVCWAPHWTQGMIMLRSPAKKEPLNSCSLHHHKCTKFFWQWFVLLFPPLWPQLAGEIRSTASAPDCGCTKEAPPEQRDCSGGCWRLFLLWQSNCKKFWSY